MYKCKNCGGVHVYELELRTDYNSIGVINPMNNNIPDITNDDLPYRLNMCYCQDCKSITEIEE